MPSEVNLSPLRQKALTATLTAPGQGGPSRFRAHTGAKSMLLFACSFRGLKCAFHMGKDGSAYGRTGSGLVNCRAYLILERITIASQCRF